MKVPVFFLIICLFAVSADAATGRVGRSMTGQMMAAPRATASVNQLSAMAAASGAGATSTSTSVSISTGESMSGATTDKSSIRYEEVVATKPTVSVSGSGGGADVVDNRAQEKAACINNNIGIGNTFVWASRYSAGNNYISMVEDMENPENNVCFVRVELKSDDARINVGDIPGRYYMMGETITCGEWADEDRLERRILDAKKTARTWATVGAAVGSAGVGVAVMELGGNKLINGKVEGQASNKLSDEQRLRSQLLVLKQEDKKAYDEFVRNLNVLKDECDQSKWSGTTRPDECTTFDEKYKDVLSQL